MILCVVEERKSCILNGDISADFLAVAEGNAMTAFATKLDGITIMAMDMKIKYPNELSHQTQEVQDAVKLLYAYYMNYWLLEVEPTLPLFPTFDTTMSSGTTGIRQGQQRLQARAAKPKSTRAIPAATQALEALALPQQAVQQKHSFTSTEAPVAPPRTQRNANRLAITETSTAAEPVANSTTIEPITSTSLNNLSKIRLDIEVVDSSRPKRICRRPTRFNDFAVSQPRSTSADILRNSTHHSPVSVRRIDVDKKFCRVNVTIPLQSLLLQQDRWRKREIKNFNHSTRVSEHNAEAKCTTLVVDTKKAMETSKNTQMKRNNCRKK
ncbi:hypothetical protein DAPPUDRAFT_113952 [Daphnia pulex]|uniref:Uncharacterized protein n=1 Tax=Daphnia pulex TaxID=6669 RepID=E9HGL3_DAPPU|nr:hypothetical protein DAPPUDRAFT_113952 [Daphnia pulex]|eukprot:EFX69104.1 hypothetical protein DAPPUDRAFT_113952 [Daphnia pulex]